MFEARSIKEILNLLHIDVIGERIESVHTMIREGYPVRKYVLENYEEFKREVTRYYQYHFAMWMQGTPTMPSGLAHQRVNNLLDNSPDVRLSRVQSVLDEGEGGYVVAVKNSLTGRNGGFVRVIDIIAESMKQDAVKKYIRAVFLDCINPLDFDKRCAFMQEYLEMFGGVLLPGEDLLSVYELASNLEAVIQHHVRQVNEFRKTLQ